MRNNTNSSLNTSEKKAIERYTVSSKEIQYADHLFKRLTDNYDINLEIGTRTLLKKRRATCQLFQGSDYGC